MGNFAKGCWASVELRVATKEERRSCRIGSSCEHNPREENFCG